MIVRNRQRKHQSATLLTDIAREVRAGVNMLAQLLGTPAGERATHREELLGLEGRVMDLHFNLMTHIRSVFLTPLPRQDIYAISQQLNRTMEHVVAAGDLILRRKSLQLPAEAADLIEALARQVELTDAAMSRLDDFDHLENYWAQLQRLSKQANRTHRDWVISTDSAFQPNIAQQQAQLADQILAAVHSQRKVAVICGSIIVRES
ncbi:DUF47 domain-containing protein [Nesterenkonia ebinurensis]|uniref:DUF47 domain-containing protein n=1 Tax=Nesterenkonia ebinurensis TaxID=2608252 RepID=UPI00123D8E7D|nr:nuclease PIN [Nesterenkonia ebinurensis]